MRKKILGILVCTLLIAATVLPVAGAMNFSITKINRETFGSDDQSVTWIDANYMPVLTDEEYEEKRLEAYKENASTRGWYWKPSYPNYAPSGMPDFDQKQDQWKTIYPGPNGVLDSLPPAGDDIHNPNENCIAPGLNCTLDTNLTGDDVAVWSFCGPTAVANCFWWFDSKYADPTGTPGDGKDKFPLVQDYTVGDDHSKSNVPPLICKLANAMKTCSKGTTYINDMQAGIDQWFNDTGLSHNFTEHTAYAPTFQYTEVEIERSQDVILLLGFYDWGKVVDQQQIRHNWSEEIPDEPGVLWQKFFPTVTVLDAVQIKLMAISYPTYNYITVDILDSNMVLLGSSTRFCYVPGLNNPTWFQFHFDPSIPLTPPGTYYITVKKGYYYSNLHWMAWLGPPDEYDGPGTSSLGGTADFTFKTEYYGCVRKGGHYVTCAGVNSEEKMIAFSDPYWDIQNQSQNATEHNDAQYVSHDIYNVKLGCPCPYLGYKWWLSDYPAEVDYTIVEQAVIICPKPDTNPPSVNIIKPIKALYVLNNKILPLPITIIIGGIDIDVQASDNLCIDRVEFYIDGSLKYTDRIPPYTWKWSTPAFFRHTITIKAYDNAGNCALTGVKVWKFF